MARRKPKYKVGHTVYCSPWKVNKHLCSVFKCVVDEIGYCGASPYYDLTVLEKDDKRGDMKLFVVYEDELSKRKERLVRQARKNIENTFYAYIQSYENLHKSLDELQ